MFFNVWAGICPEVISYVKNSAKSVDVFCLSEVNNLINLYSNDPFPYLPKKGKATSPNELNLFSLLRNSLIDTHIGFHSPSVRGVHDLEESELKVEYGLATFIRRDLFPYTYRTGSLHRELGQFNGCTSASRAIVSMTLPYKGGALLLGHMHGLWNGEGKGDSPDRFAQSSRALEFLRNHKDYEARGARMPGMFGGDFNLTSGTHALRMLVKSKVFGPEGGESLNATFNIKDTRTLYYEKDEREADFVIASPWLKANLKVERNVPSDHAALIVDL